MLWVLLLELVKYLVLIITLQEVVAVAQEILLVLLVQVV
jgi:hypothetical protein